MSNQVWSLHSSNTHVDCRLETDPEIVMAAQSAHDVVNHVRSVGDLSLADDNASTTNQSQTAGKVEESPKSTTSSVRETHDKSLPPHLRGLGFEVLRSPELQDASMGNAKNLQVVESDAAGEPPSVEASGDKFETSDAEDPTALPGSVEASIGSDSETGRAEYNNASAQPDSDLKGHNRSNSMKKPASFKAVSVTKNFLAKAANGTVQSVKLGGDKVMTTSNGQPTMSSTTAASRPRLVAKSASGRDGGLRGSASPAGSGQGKAPDPSQVWNKNRPVQPPAPKHVTDEELKQQYGIHLATRLQADETSKEAKWADIDDDDDDWAPEIIEWNDGTKITLPTLEEQANLTPAKTPTPAPKDDPSVLPKAVQPALNRIASDTVGAGPPKATNINNPQPKAAGLVLKGASEKPTLVAKPPAPVPVKSPWAPLPPVEKVPPVTIKPQSSQPTERVQREPPGVEPPAPVPSPAKEIAADDFNRSWRDNQSVPNRELFNSQSGRYEPVGDNRRGSMRGEHHFRQPSVLQRPLQPDQKGPAEPSATFQTNRSGGQDAAWGRRRTSSNVSGGSGNLQRRMSIGKGQDLQHHSDTYAGSRRGSHQPSHPDSTAALATSQSHFAPHEEYPHNRGRPDMQQNRQHASHGPLQMNAARAQDARNLQEHSQRQEPQRPNAEHGLTAQVTQQMPVEDPIAMQRKIMREGRELAVKRRREQEEKEEAEKQERIRKKLEALGHAVAKPEKSEGADSASASQTREAKSPQSPAPRVATIPSGSPPKPPVPEVSGEVKQYGMMKVHHPEPVKKPFPARQQAPKPGNNADHMDGQMPSPPNPLNNNRKQPLTNGISNLVRSEGDNSTPQSGRQHSPPDLSRQQPWGKAPIEPHHRKAWGGAAIPTRASQISQLWSPAGTERALGNGTFTGDYPGLANMREPQTTAQQPPSRDPGPIGPPTPSQPSSDRRKSPLVAEELSQPGQNGPHTLNTQAKQSDQPGHSFHSRLGTGIVTSTEPGTVPTATASSIQPRMTDRQKALAAWKNLPAQLEAQDAEAKLRAVRERAARDEELARLGAAADLKQPAFQETWRQVVMDDHRRQRKLVGVSKVVVATGESVSTATKDGRPQLPQSTVAPTVHTSSPLPLNAGHASRFFPPTSEVPHAPLQRDGAGSVLIEYDPTPPPDSFDHPAYDGDMNHPLVCLPPPKPVVRLPPALTQGSSTDGDVSMKETDSARSLPQHIDPAPSWQDRIYGLFGRKPSVSTKPQTLTVSSASKAPLEVTASERSATVSLPVQRSDSGAPTDGPDSISEEAGTVTLRATDEVLFEEREFGSLPTVKLPARAPANAWQPARAPHSHKVRAKPQKSVQVLSIEPIEPYIIKEGQTPHGTIIEVHLPGVLTMQAFLRTRSNDTPRQRTSSSSNGYWKNARRVNRSRETSGNFQPSRPVQGGSLRSNPSIPSNINNTNNATWARRVSGMV